MSRKLQRLRDHDTNPCIKKASERLTRKILQVELPELDFPLSSQLYTQEKTAETDASRKCMDDSNYNKDACANYFLRYRNCRKFWNGIMMQRRVDGIQPSMPTAEEREKILASMERIPY